MFGLDSSISNCCLEEKKRGEWITCLRPLVGMKRIIGLPLRSVEYETMEMYKDIVDPLVPKS